MRIATAPPIEVWENLDDFARRVDAGGGRSAFPIVSVEVGRTISLRRVPVAYRAEKAARLDANLHFLYPGLEDAQALVIGRRDEEGALLLIVAWRLDDADRALLRQLVEMKGSLAFLPTISLSTAPAPPRRLKEGRHG